MDSQPATGEEIGYFAVILYRRSSFLNKKTLLYRLLFIAGKQRQQGDFPESCQPIINTRKYLNLGVKDSMKQDKIDMKIILLA